MYILVVSQYYQLRLIHLLPYNLVMDEINPPQPKEDTSFTSKREQGTAESNPSFSNDETDDTLESPSDNSKSGQEDRNGYIRILKSYTPFLD